MKGIIRGIFSPIVTKKPNHLYPKTYSINHPLVKRPQIDEKIKNYILGSNNGIGVFWSPRGSGKTLYFKSMANQYNSNDNKKIILNDSVEPLISNQQIEDYLKQQKKSDYTFIIDDFDTVYHEPQIVCDKYWMITSMASNAMTNKYKIILGISDPLICSEILRFSDGKNITNLLSNTEIWTDGQIIEFVDNEMKQISENLPAESKKIITDSDYQQICVIAKKSKNLMFIKSLISGWYSKITNQQTKKISIYDPRICELAQNHAEQCQLEQNIICWNGYDQL